MHSQAAESTAEKLLPPETVPVRLLPRVWPAAVIVTTYWIVSLLPAWIDGRIFVSFISGVISSALLALAFWIWWFTNRTIPLADRLFAFCANVAGAVVAGFFCHKSLGAFGILLFGVPSVFTVWTIWLVLARRSPPVVRGWGLAICIWLTWATFTLVRVDGVNGDTKSAISWRFSRRAEDLYLAEQAHAAASTAAPRVLNEPSRDVVPLKFKSGDWPGFRGAARDSVVHNVKLATDWNASPPQAVWQRRVGPAWSSFVVIGDRMFTQEQRGESEIVVCLATETGQEIWSHADPVRFEDGQAGAGPRATPTFAEGRIYSFGATGIVNCLDGADGQAIWTRDVTADSDGKAPMWGFSSSPLVVNGVVVVYAGGQHDQALVAYDAQTGEPRWKAVTGEVSYSSPQLASIGGEPQILFLSERGLTAIAPSSGQILWNFEAVRQNIWRAAQPRLVGDSQVLFGSEDLGLMLVDVAQSGTDWTANRRWNSNSMRPAYNDFVVHDGFAYGFDGAIFCCIDLRTGARRWKGGHYGHGQVLLLADQPLLLVLSESGEAVLLAVNPQRHEELGRFQALQGKTWNHPVLAHGRLLVRNDAQMACYAPKLLETK